MQLTILRGAKEVGGNCIEVSTGKTRIILDVGMPLFDENRQALDSFAMRRMTTEELNRNGVLPKVPGLFSLPNETDPNELDAILLSHAHLDHVGLLSHTGTNIPIYASTGTSKMMLAGAVFANQNELPRERFRELRPNQRVQIGDFTVTSFPVDHSIFGCLSFLIEANGKRIFYTGDLRLHGSRPEEHKRIVEALGSTALDALIVEGTHFGFVDGNKVTEQQLEFQIAGHIKDSRGLVLASFSPQNVDRLKAFIRATKETNRTFVADAYTAFVLHLISTDANIENPLKTGHARVYFPGNLKEKIERRGTNRANELFRESEIDMAEILDEPERYVMVFRSSMLGDFGGKFPTQTHCLYSTWHGYSDRPDWQKVKKALDHADGKLTHVHTSGHALSSDIVEFTKAMNAKTIIPIHSFEPETFKEYFDNVTIATDGETIEI